MEENIVTEMQASLNKDDVMNMQFTRYVHADSSIIFDVFMFEMQRYHRHA